MTLQKAPVARAQMLIRRPVGEVFGAFIDPAVTTKFWFTHSTGPLVSGAAVRWDWAMYGVSAEVHVKAVDPEKRILIEWPDHHGKLCPVEWRFTVQEDGSTFVEVTNWGFSGSDDDVVAQALDATGGFHLVLAGCKAWLEHGVALGLVGDHAPQGS